MSDDAKKKNEAKEQPSGPDGGSMATAGPNANAKGEINPSAPGETGTTEKTHS